MFEQVWRLTDRARELDPNAPPIKLEIAMNTLHEGRLDEGERMIDEIWFDIGLRSPVVWVGKWFALLEREDWRGLEKWTDEIPFDAPKPLFRRFARLSGEGDKAEREVLAADIAVASQTDLPPWLAYIMLEQMGETDRALVVAEQHAEAGQFVNSVVMFDSSMTDARQTERFASIADRLGYIDYWRRNGPPTVCAAESETPVCRKLASATASEIR